MSGKSTDKKTSGTFLPLVLLMFNSKPAAYRSRCSLEYPDDLQDITAGVDVSLGHALSRPGVIDHAVACVDSDMVDGVSAVEYQVAGLSAGDSLTHSPVIAQVVGCVFIYHSGMVDDIDIRIDAGCVQALEDQA